MERKCFLLQLKKDRLQDYLKAHQVWPEMRAAIHDSGIRNYSIFFRPDGMLVGYMEGENIKESLRKLGETDVSKRWEATMGEFFESGPVEDDNLEWLEHYFFNP